MDPTSFSAMTTFVKDAGLIGVLIAIILTLFLGKWVPGWIYRQSEARVLWWQTYALSLQDLTEQAVRSTEKAIEARKS